MDRVKKGFTGSLLLILLMTIASCRDPMDLLGKLEDDVKAANDLYLEVVNITPGENELNFNPGEPIRIEFDRAIDMSTFEEVFSLVNDEGNEFESDLAGKSLEYSFNTDTNILTISADPFLDGLEDYKLTLLEGLKGVDGSLMREPLTQSFKTSDAPRGSIRIIQDYTNQTNVDVEITSQGATYFEIAVTEAELDGTGWIEITSGKMTVDPVYVPALSGSDGTKTFYMRLRDGAVNEGGSATISNIESDNVVYDTEGPLIDFGDGVIYSNASTVASLTGVVSDSMSPIKSYLWNDESGSGVSIGNISSLSTTANIGSDGEYFLSLVATDQAGNSSYSEIIYIRDSVPPTITVPSNISTSTNADIDLIVDASDDRSEISSYKWSLISAPGDYSISSTTEKTSLLRVYDEVNYTARVTVYDKAGNQNSDDITIFCSNSKPSISLSKSVFYLKSSTAITAKVDYNHVSGGTVQWVAKEGATDVTGVKVNFSDTTVLNPTISATTEGEYTISCTATNDGAQFNTASATLVWDTTSPKVSVNSYTTTVYTNSSSSFSASVTETGSGIQSYTWTKTGVGTVSFSAPNSLSTTATPSVDGSYDIILTAMDKAGNTSEPLVSTSDRRKLIRDTIAPSPPSVSTIEITSVTTPKYTLSFGNGGMNYYRSNINSGKWGYFTSTDRTLTLPYGGTTVAFQGKDQAGNWSGSNTQTTVVYPTKGPYPASGGTLSGDMAWPYYSTKYYTVFVGLDDKNVTTVFGTEYRPYPYVDSSEISTPLKTTTLYWKVVVYTRSLSIRGGYQYTEYTTLPATGAYSMVVPSERY